MPANFFRSDEWTEIIAAIRAGADERARELLISRDRKVDQYFANFDISQYTPVVRQASSTITLVAATSFVEAFKVGPWISINAYLHCNSAGTLGSPVLVTLPAQFAAVAAPSGTAGRSVGTFFVQDFGTTTRYSGDAVITSTSGGLTLLGWSDGQTAPLGAAGWTDAIAANDFIGFSIQYRTQVPV